MKRSTSVNGCVSVKERSDTPSTRTKEEGTNPRHYFKADGALHHQQARLPIIGGEIKVWTLFVNREDEKINLWKKSTAVGEECVFAKLHLRVKKKVLSRIAETWRVWIKNWPRTLWLTSSLTFFSPVLLMTKSSPSTTFTPCLFQQPGGKTEASLK